MRLLDRVPPRYRPIVRMLIVAFMLFEISRAAALGSFLWPIWQDYGGQLAAQARHPLWISILAMTATALAFLLPMGGFILGLRALKRRLSR